MKGLGWLLFGVGAIFLFLAGFVESAGVNIPGLILGMALLVSGSIFAAAGHIVEELRQSVETIKSPTITQKNTSARKFESALKKADAISLPPDFNRMVKEHKEKNLKGKTVTIYEFDEGSFVVENSDSRWARYDTLEQARTSSF